MLVNKADHGIAILTGLGVLLKQPVQLASRLCQVGSESTSFDRAS
ncbi:hypothetical protein [Endozoicomonas sp. 4G]|nr:hypothetical protein [Endozoicomonas sp. 4G]